MNHTTINSFLVMCKNKYSMLLCPLGHKYLQVYSLEYTNQFQHCLVRKFIHLALMSHTTIDLFSVMSYIKYSMFLCPLGHKYSEIYLHKYTNQLQHWLVRKLIHLILMNHTTIDWLLVICVASKNQCSCVP